MPRRTLDGMTLTASPARTATDVAARTVAATKIYGRGDQSVTALDDVDLEIPAGRFTAVMGPSGSGKSTLMHVLAGLDSLTSGEVYIGATELGSLDDRTLTRLRRDRIGFVFQAYNLMPTLTAYENITLPFALAGRKPDREWVDRVIDSVSLGPRLRHRPSELSGGQQQRVAVARALATRPELVFADEPTGNLDSTTGAEVLEFLRAAVRTMGQTVVMVTHDPVAAGYADRVVFLSDGRVSGGHGRTDARACARRPQGPAIPQDDRSLTMLRLVLSSLRANARRLTSTSIAVCLGVALLAGTMVLGDTLKSNFDSLFQSALGNADAVVRSANTLDTDGEYAQDLIDGSLADQLAGVDGVAAVAPQIEGFGQLTGSDGEKLGGNGPPTLAGNWIEDQDLNPYELVEGRAPEATDEVVINRGAAEDGDLAVGDTTIVATPEPVEVTIVGIATFGGEDGLGPIDVHGVLPRRGRGAHDRAPGRGDVAAGAGGERHQRGRGGRSSRRRHVRGRRSDQRLRAGRGGQRPDRRRLPRLSPHVPRRVRRGRPAGRHVQHQQHVCDHRRPASALVGVAAGGRRRAPPGPVDDDRRGSARRGGGVRRRPRGRHRARPGHQGAVQRLRVRPARRRTDDQHRDPRHRPARRAGGDPVRLARAGRPGVPCRPARRAPRRRRRPHRHVGRADRRGRPADRRRRRRRGRWCVLRRSRRRGARRPRHVGGGGGARTGRGPAGWRRARDTDRPAARRSRRARPSQRRAHPPAHGGDGVGPDDRHRRRHRVHRVRRVAEAVRGRQRRRRGRGRPRHRQQSVRWRRAEPGHRRRRRGAAGGRPRRGRRGRPGLDRQPHPPGHGARSRSECRRDRARAGGRHGGRVDGRRDRRRRGAGRRQGVDDRHDPAGALHRRSDRGADGRARSTSRRPRSRS